MADIFLSYARNDAPVVSRLADALEDAGYSVWWDRHIKGGTDFSKDIEKAIEEARAVLVVWSKTSLESEWVRDEAAFARDAGKFVPVTIDKSLPPLGFRQRQAIDLSVGLHDPAKMAQLADALNPLVGGKAHTIDAADKPNGISRKTSLFALPFLAVAGVAGWWAMSGESYDGDAADTAIADPRTVAVLPFVAGSSNDDDQYFADGVSEEILNRLDALPDLRVTPRTTAFSFRDSDEPLSEIAASLGVSHLVEGSLRKSGDDVRVTARLVRASDGETIWSDTYDGSGDDVLAIQSEIAEQAASALGILLDEEMVQRMADAGIDDPEAFAIYAEAAALDAEAHASLDDLTTFARAVELYEAAFARSEKLWRAPLQIADFYDHVLIDEAAGIIHNELPADLRQNALEMRAKQQSRAIAAAPEGPDRVGLQIMKKAFSSDWRGLRELSLDFYRSDNGCNFTNWPGLLLISSGDANVFYENMANVKYCAKNDYSYPLFLTRAGIASGRVEDVRKLFDEITADAPLESNFLNGARHTLLTGENNVAGLRRLARETGGESPLITADFLQGKRNADVWTNERLAAITPFAAIPRIAWAGEREAVNQLAARIDSHPIGPAVLQLATDSCYCGAPFDIENTPNYAARLKEAGVSWPPKATINWPLKDW